MFPLLLVLLPAQEKTVMRQVAIPREVYTGTSTQLFDFLAQALADFIKEQEKVSGCPSLFVEGWGG